MKFSYDLLIIICERDKAQLTENYSVSCSLNRNSDISFKCNCGNIGRKIFRSIVINSGLYCKNCTNKNKKEKTIETNLKLYDVEYGLQNKDIKEKKNKTVFSKYGVDNISQLQYVKDKKCSSSKEKYGVNYPLQHLDVKNKLIRTNLDKYGVKYTTQNEEVKEKMKKSIKNKYGVNNPFQSNEIKEKIKQKILQKYNVEYPSQNQEIQDKIQHNSKKFKEYIMPSGNMRKVQGYEPFALDILIQIYTEEQLKTNRKEVPRIKYIVNEKDKYYFPDIYIPDENKIIEVKSIWTFNLHKEIVNLKKEACISQGYNYEIWCFNHKGEKIDIENCDE